MVIFKSKLTYGVLVALMTVVLAAFLNRLEHANKNSVFIPLASIAANAHNTEHAKIYSNYTSGYNVYILKAIDKIQARSMNGGGYFMAANATPSESPLGYPLALFGKSLLQPPRSSSYCSGVTYGAFIEALNLLYPSKIISPDADHLEAFQMQEADGLSRLDNIKFWGYWNTNGFGSYLALTHYSGMGEEVRPEHAQPGDFMNIDWKSGRGHSVVFLGWFKNDKGKRGVIFWSSQKDTNGMGDKKVLVEAIRKVKIVRLTHPEKIFSFITQHSIPTNVPGVSP